MHNFYCAGGKFGEVAVVFLTEKTLTGHSDRRRRTLSLRVRCAVNIWRSLLRASDAMHRTRVRPYLCVWCDLTLVVRLWVSLTEGIRRLGVSPVAASGDPARFDNLSAYMIDVHQTRLVSTWSRPVVRIWPLEINARGSISWHVAGSGAPDAGLEHPVVTCCASGDPVFYSVEEPTALFVLRGL